MYVLLLFFSTHAYYYCPDELASHSTLGQHFLSSYPFQHKSSDLTFRIFCPVRITLIHTRFTSILDFLFYHSRNNQEGIKLTLLPGECVTKKKKRKGTTEDFHTTRSLKHSRTKFNEVNISRHLYLRKKT